MKKRSINILIISLLLLGIIAIMLTVFIYNAHDKFKENVKVKIDGVTEETLTVRDLKLAPTEKKEYEILLTCDASGSFYISLDYEETGDGGMKHFVDVSVKCEGEEVYSGNLLELLDEDKIILFEGELHAKEPLIVTVCYEMPYDVGNEAQGTFADFNIHLMIKKS